MFAIENVINIDYCTTYQWCNMPFAVSSNKQTIRFRLLSKLKKNAFA